MCRPECWSIGACPTLRRPPMLEFRLRQSHDWNEQVFIVDPWLRKAVTSGPFSKAAALNNAFCVKRKRLQGDPRRAVQSSLTPCHSCGSVQTEHLTIFYLGQGKIELQAMACCLCAMSETLCQFGFLSISRLYTVMCMRLFCSHFMRTLAIRERPSFDWRKARPWP